jgi:hypothetical protein
LARLEAARAAWAWLEPARVGLGLARSRLEPLGLGSKPVGLTLNLNLTLTLTFTPYPYPPLEQRSQFEMTLPTAGKEEMIPEPPPAETQVPPKIACAPHAVLQMRDL